MHRSRYPLALVSTAILVASASAATVPAVAAPGIAFGVPVVVDPIHTNGEPDIGIDPQGRVFVSGPTGTGTQRGAWLGAVDKGHTFGVISPGAPPSAIAGLTAPPGGGDTDINFDRSAKHSFIDLYALTCNRTAMTADGGATVNQSVYPAGCAGVPGADRPWLAVFDPAPGTANQSAYKAAGGPTPLVYAAYNNLVGPGPNSGTQWIMSLDGLNYTNATGDEVPPGTGAVYSPFGADGYPAIDQVTGKVFQAAGCRTSNGCTSDGIYLNIGTPDATGTLHFLDATGSGQDLTRLIKIADTPTGSPDTLFSVLSMDSARNLYVVWNISARNPALRQVFVSAASAASGWSSWTPPVQVSDGSTGTGDAVNVFPWIKAGGPGRADTVWYGSDKNVDPSSQSGQSWDGFMSQVVYPTNATGGLTGAAPSTRLVKVTPHPMHYNDICLQGTGCIESQGNRNLADFFAITIDARGAAEIVYDDTSNGLVQPGFTPDNQQLVDHAGAGVITIAQQSAGPGLFGSTVSGSSSGPVSSLSDTAGDALYPVIGGVNVPGMDILSSQLSLSSRTLTVTAKVADLTNPALTIARVPGAAYVQYVTRWQMGSTIYYAAMENTAL